MIDHYKTLQGKSIGAFKDRGSKFIAYAYPAYTEQEWQTHLNTVKKEHFKARHHCFAFRIGMDNNNFRTNDDGEPSGTAGRPILSQIDSYSLRNVFVVVVRYFGGTKLGTSGLINAYKQATIDAFEQATIIEKTIEDVYKISFDYALMSNVMNAVKKLNLDVVVQEFTETAYIDFAIRQSETTMTLRQLRSSISGIRIEEIDAVKKIPGLKLDFLYTR